MSEPLDERYFRWLYSHTGSVRLRDSGRTYWKLAKQLFTTEFLWFVPNDDNRIGDGEDLKYEFVDEMGWEMDMDWLSTPCSVLEVMIGLARRLSFEAEGEPRRWFWELIDNLEIKINDAQYDELHEEEIQEVLERVIWRNYQSNGKGGLFPLKNAEEDQRKVELWYQLNAYVIERE